MRSTQPIPMRNRGKYGLPWIQGALSISAQVLTWKICWRNLYALSLIYRIDYTIAPEGQAVRELNGLPYIYFARMSAITENRRTLSFNLSWPVKRRGIYLPVPDPIHLAILFHHSHTRSFRMLSCVVNQNMPWYRENGNPFVAGQVTEYGWFVFPSLPRILTELFHLYTGQLCRLFRSPGIPE